MDFVQKSISKEIHATDFQRHWITLTMSGTMIYLMENIPLSRATVIYSHEEFDLWTLLPLIHFAWLLFNKKNMLHFTIYLLYSEQSIVKFPSLISYKFTASRQMTEIREILRKNCFRMKNKKKKRENSSHIAVVFETRCKSSTAV